MEVRDIKKEQKEQKEDEEQKEQISNLPRPPFPTSKKQGSSASYQGSFSLLLTCRQLRYEAALFLYKNYKFDLKPFTAVKEALDVLGTEITSVVETIEIPCWEAYRALYHRGGRYDNGSIVYDIAGLVPSLQRVETVYWWKIYDRQILRTMEALRIYFGKHDLDVDIQKAPFLSDPDNLHPPPAISIGQSESAHLPWRQMLATLWADARYLWYTVNRTLRACFSNNHFVSALFRH